ncbi:polyketide synthase, putative [Talaromyces stipitatus ATCC 10500]|uniref:Polyketide synthase, putative n=2 Tax=Talaromyces stipitatus TaxID=28564 RepID=B8LZ55_TALSN|nr:polyketide synthase, putative [Talaromyces stipitatus ATCC 10500]AWS21681.1 non-reducing polyketide synthase [Talaromyces stipitatus]EED21099.1 polyketide synthase, putative [Talaromyces stipitatus ATCC 10500]
MAGTAVAFAEAPTTVNGMNKEASVHIYIFGDQTVSFEDTLRSLLNIKDNAALSDFFNKVGLRLRSYIGGLPLHERDFFPQFTTLVDLFARHDQFAGAPALKFTLLCVTQIGQWIRYYGKGPKVYPSPTSTYLAGACTGSFAVAAISTSRSIGELLSPAVEAVLIAFKTASYSLSLRKDLGFTVSGGPNSWSVVVGVQESEAARLVENFNSAKGLPVVSSIYLSCMNRNNTSVCGPPELLLEFLSSNSLKHLSLPIEIPYHAPHIFNASAPEKLVGPFSDVILEDYRQCFKSISIASGEVITSSSFRELLQRAVSETLLEPMRWDVTISSIGEELVQENFTSCDIYSVSSKSGQSLSSALSQDAKLRVNISNSLEVSSGSSNVSSTGNFSDSDIAIIGYSGRFPESASNEEFWELLIAGRDVHRTIPEDRFDWKAHYDPTGKTKNTSRVKYGCFVKEPGLFDARFFNMSPRECENCDPAQRLAITSAYEAIEMAGLVSNRTPSTQQDRIGVFYGVTSDDWREVNSGQDIDTYFIPGGNRAFIPGRISYFFRFCGPSLSVDTACSSSFAAIQTACAYLWRGECDTALAGGANILTNPDNFAGLDRGHFLSTTGNCNAFDDTANGYCRSDAVGTVILKRMEDAIADNDPIFGVIRGAYTNHCGRTDSITRPFEGDQAAVFNRIMRYAGVNPLDVGYVEMHGTGTQAGDATEMRSVLSVFAPFSTRKFPLHLGTVKANIGHAESASGVASLIKVLLMMKHNAIPPHCGIKTKINHNYPTDLKERNIHIPFQLTPWSREDMSLGKRLVFLNNFSAAGGNTAVLLEDAPVRNAKDGNDSRSKQPVTVTGKTVKSLKGNIEKLIRYLDQYPDTSVSSLSYTTTARRMHHTYRAIVSGYDVESIRSRLQKILESVSETKPIPTASKLPKTVLVFTGQGAAYQGLGKELFETAPIFRDSIIRFDNIAQQQGLPSFLPLVCSSSPDRPVHAYGPIVTHLALVCVQMALYTLWRAWGVTASATIGHSLGEYPALYAAGVLTAANVIYLVGTRARLLTEKTTPGTHAMLAVKLSAVAIERELQGSGCEIGCFNQPSNNVVTGPLEQLTQLQNRLKSRGVECMLLDIPYAFHSNQVEPILASFEKAASAVNYNQLTIPYISPLLSKVVSPEDNGEFDCTYLTNACRQPVKFQDAIEAAQASSHVDEKTIWIEVGSHPTCIGMIKSILSGQSPRVFGSLRKDTDDWTAIMPAIEGLYQSGFDIQWSEYHRGFENEQEVLGLPSYAWDLKNYWIQYRNNFCLTKGDDPVPTTSIASGSPVAQKRVPYVSPSVQRILEEDNGTDASTLVAESDIHDPRLAPILEGHVVNGAMLCPSSLYADVAITITQYMAKAIGIYKDTTGLDVADMKVINPLILNKDCDAQLYQVVATAQWKQHIVSFKLFSVNNAGRKTGDHATFTVRITPNQNWIAEWQRQAYLIRSRISALQNSVKEGSAHILKRPLAYQLFSTLVSYNTDYQGMQEVMLDSDEHEATTKVEFQVDDRGFKFNPCWVDSLGHIAGFIMNASDATPTKSQVFINHGWDRMRCAINFEKGVEYQVYNRMQLESGTTYVGDTYIFKGNSLVGIYEGIRFQGVPRQLLDRLLPSRKQTQQRAVSDKPPVQSSNRQPNPSAAQPTNVVSQKPTLAVKQKPVVSTAPRPNEIASRVLTIIGEEAGVDPTELDPNEDFQNHGIDSLLSLTICGRIQEELGVEVPSSLFADYCTPLELSRFFGSDNNHTSSASSASSSDDTDGINTPDNREIDSDTSTEGETGNSILEVIREMIAQETGVPVSELSLTSSFADLGVDSLLTLTIVGKLTETLDMDIPSNLLMECENLEEVSKALGLQEPPLSLPAEPVLNTGKITKFSFDPHAGPQSTSILLSGNAKTANKIFFLFPDGSGSATSYASLPKFGSDVVVYGLNCPYMKTPHAMTGTLEELTSKYLVEIRRRQPNGPYYLGGWSAGGICAYEAAQQLAREGCKTEKLILIDSPNPVGLENPPQRMYDFFESIGIFGSGSKPPPSWLRPHFDAFIRLLDNYKIRPVANSGFKMEVYMLYARDGICSDPSVPRPEIRPDDPREMIWLLNERTDFSGDGWASIVGRENLQITVMDKVNHFSMMDKGPHMEQFASFLHRALA